MYVIIELINLIWVLFEFYIQYVASCTKILDQNSLKKFHAELRYYVHPWKHPGFV